MKHYTILDNIILNKKPSFFASFIIATLGFYILFLGLVNPYPRRVLASWYGAEFSGKKTASGKPYNPKKLTAAHRTLPFGTKVKVTNLHNNRSVIVNITDRGPYIRRRAIDLSLEAARSIDMFQAGVVLVEIEPVSP